MMPSRLFFKILNRSPKHISPYPAFLSFQLTRNNTFKPSFLIKKSYYSTMSLSSNKKSKLKEYYPYIYSYLIWVMFGSTLLHLSWSKMSYNEYKEQMQFKITKLEETLTELEKGENIYNNLLLTKKSTGLDDELHNEAITESQITTKPSVKWV